MKRKYIYFIAFISITIFLMVIKRYSLSKKMFEVWKLRGCDPNGCGGYGASRSGGKRKHNGLDVAAAAGTTIFAPYDCEIFRPDITVYTDRPEFRGLELKATNPIQSGINVKLFYVVTLPHLTTGAKVKQGDPIATVQDRAGKLDMINHVHIEIWEAGKNRNPENYFI
jgi:hypothetical protein